MPSDESREAWLVDQFAKSLFFHQKLHDWGVLEVADAIAAVDGAQLDWDFATLGISETAWKRVIHRGIPPVTVFAHPAVLVGVDRAIAYYRQLAMISQKASSNIGLNAEPFETGRLRPSLDVAARFAAHLNVLISRLIEADAELDPREFALWRGMATGAQAQGSWQNQKGQRAEKVVQDLIRARLLTKQWVTVSPDEAATVFTLTDGRQIRFAKDPDIGIYRDGHLAALVEIKGGIDSAGILERFGAMVKSFDHARSGGARTVKAILIVQGASLTVRARQALSSSGDVDAWFTVGELLTDLARAEALFTLLDL